MNKKLALLALGLFSLSGAAQAALHDRGGGLIYDDVLNVTWLQDANYAKTSGYDVDGMMNWNQATTWAASLSYYDNVRNVTYDDWRLPFIVDTGTIGCNLANSGTDCGFNVQTLSSTTAYSEMAVMYYVNLGLKAFQDPNGRVQYDSGIFGNGTWNGTDNSSYGQNDVGLFDNLQAFAYLSGSERALDAANPTSIGVWNFGMNDGFQDTNYKSLDYFAWAVRDGDVAAVPEPEASAMMLVGVGIIGFAAYRRKKKAS